MEIQPTPFLGGAPAVGVQIDVRERLDALKRRDGGAPGATSAAAALVAILLSVAALWLFAARHRRKKNREVAEHQRRREEQRRARAREVTSHDGADAGVAWRGRRATEAPSRTAPAPAGAPVVVLGLSPMLPPARGSVREVDASGFVVDLEQPAWEVPARAFVAREGDGDRVLHLADLDVSAPGHGGEEVRGRVDVGTGPVQIAPDGLYPVQLPASIVTVPPATSSDPAGTPPAPVTVVAIGLRRALVRGADILPHDRDLVLRCALPGEDDSVTFRIAGGSPGRDHEQNFALELTLEPLAPADVWRVARHLGIASMQQGAPEPTAVGGREEDDDG